MRSDPHGIAPACAEGTANKRATLRDLGRVRSGAFTTLRGGTAYSSTPNRRHDQRSLPRLTALLRLLLKKDKNMKQRCYLLTAACLLLGVGCGIERDGPGASAENANNSTAQASAALATKPATLVPDVCMSSHREPNTDWTVYRDACRKAILESEARVNGIAVPESLGTTPEYCASHPLEVDCNDVAPANANFSNVPFWNDVDIKTHFKSSRDARFLYASDNTSFVRRISWLYPDDGCFARAELVSSLAGDAGRPKPYRLFSFGNLRVNTSNHPNGYVTWRYHVVPIVRSATTGEVWVFDAAIDPLKPMPWQSWLLKQVASLNDVTVTVADSNAFGPGDPIIGGTNQRALAVSYEQSIYLRNVDDQGIVREWGRQGQLGRDPAVVLGDRPPWASAAEVFYFASENLIVPSCLTCQGAEILSPRCLADCP